jgi:Animal haem peroxidase
MMLRIAVAATVSLLTFAAVSSEAATPPPQPQRTLDGSGNNLQYPAWGQAGTVYSRVAAPNYADGVGSMVAGPNPRYISNRVFNDVGQNIFSENEITQWGWAWGQFIDHDIGLRDETPAEPAPIAFNQSDPLEQFSNETGQIDFFRTPGVGSPRQQVNTLSSFIDASQVYGVTQSRDDWLRQGARLLLPGGYLPRADARGDVSAAPPMDLMGRLVGQPQDAIVAGDVRANENMALTAIQTLFAREHNRIVGLLPDTLTQEAKFQIARRVVGAEIEYITYREFLPDLGVNLPAYNGYDPTVNPTLANEFATVGFRAHSMVHGEFEPTLAAGTFTPADLKYYTKQGITIESNADGSVTLVVPLAVAFGFPQLLKRIGEGPVLGSLDEREYNNDEQIDNSLRSVLFEVPKPGVTDPTVCGEPIVNPDCFTDVADLGADDIQRGRDHGMPTYNQLRLAYGLPAAKSFTDITGESTAKFPNDPLINKQDPIDDPNILDFTDLRDDQGNPVAVGDPDNAVSGTRRSTLAARLKAIYGSVDKVDAFVGMVSEPHVAGTEFGRLQLAIWKKQFQALRDGDRFFFRNDPVLQQINDQYGVTFRHSLAELIALDSDFTPPSGDVFHVPAAG